MLITLLMVLITHIIVSIILACYHLVLITLCDIGLVLTCEVAINGDLTLTSITCKLGNDNMRFSCWWSGLMLQNLDQSCYNCSS